VTVRTHRFPLSDTPRDVDLRNPAGSVTVLADETADELVVRIEPLDPSAEQLADRLDVVVTPSRLHISVPERRLLRTPSFAIEVRTPAGAAVRAASSSGDLELRGRLGGAELTSASGDVAVERCTELQLRSASGDARVGRVEGPATVATASGDVRLEYAGGRVQVRSASGDVRLGETAGDASVTSASGDLQIDRARRGRVQLKTVSGDAVVSVEPGLRVWLDVQSISGRLYSDLDDDTDAPAGGAADLSVVLHSVSGDLRVGRAAPAPASTPSAAAAAATDPAPPPTGSAPLAPAD
jgi:putative adhesin